MSLNEIAKANKQFSEGLSSLYSERKTVLEWAIVSCADERLVDFLTKAMGIIRGEAVVIKNEGNTVTKYDNSIIRSLSLAVVLKGVRKIAIVGHSNCRCRVDVQELQNALVKNGVNLTSIRDIREYYGIISDESQNVRNVVQSIIGSHVIPSGIDVYGLMIDSDTGKLTKVCEERTRGTKSVESRTLLERKLKDDVKLSNFKGSGQFLKDTIKQLDNMGLKKRAEKMGIKVKQETKHDAGETGHARHTGHTAQKTTHIKVDVKMDDENGHGHHPDKKDDNEIDSHKKFRTYQWRKH